MGNNDIWVFLSHSNEDYDKVRVVRNLLEEQQFRPIMFFLKCLTDAKEVDSLIKREIDCRTRFILCDSENARKSDWVKAEVKYIKDQQRTFQTIDISKPEAEIAKELMEFKEKATLFISYGRQYFDIAQKLAERLKKYDFFVFFDAIDLRDGNFKKQIDKAITSAANNGMLVCLVNQRTFSENSFSNYEVRSALWQGAKLLPIYMEDELPECELLHEIKSFSGVDVSQSEYQIDDALKGILRLSFNPGSILTFAEDFKYGRNRSVDPEEERLCSSIFIEEAEKSSNPHRLRPLSRIYEFGIGTGIDLKKAYECLNEAVHDEHIDCFTPDLIRVGKKLGYYSNEERKPSKIRSRIETIAVYLILWLLLVVIFVYLLYMFVIK